ncbi:MAG TPA: DNA recombination protein RmuC [Gemmatimonadales bacterium]|nr:DNA recombination protein RmuC [Gemmatimonadales bacterium]
MPVAVAIALLLLGALVVAVLLRRPGGERAAGLIQQQLIELRTRFDQLVAAQQEVPKALAQGSAEQARVLHDVRDRLGQLGEATKRLETMGETVTEVQQLLQVPKLRGTIGEVWLEELLEQILPASHYEMQHQFRSGERVDAVLKLGDRLVPVDAKFPLEACQRMLRAHGPEEERERRAFNRSLKDRIDEIADKYIRPDEGTYEFALLYIPAENVYYEAVMRAEDPGDGKSILGHAMRRRVIPVSPHTFYAYLLVILHGLKGMRVERHAREIQDQLGALRQQFEAFWSAFQTVGTHLANAVKKFEESVRQAGRVRDRFDEIAGASAASDSRTLGSGEDVGP